MPKVAIAAFATTPFIKNSDRSIADLAAAPCAEILRSNHSLMGKIDGVLVSTCANDQYLGPIVSEMVGLRPHLAQRIDNLCNSGTNSIVTGYSLIASGLCEAVLVAGAEKKDGPGYWLAWDVTRGSYAFPVHWGALFAKAYMRKYGICEDQLATISVYNRQHASKNPNALFQKQISVEEVMASRKIVDPLKLLDCSAACEGSSAILLVSENASKEIEDPVWIKGIGQQTSSASFANASNSLTTVDAAVDASKRAFKMAGLNPLQIDVAELHDAFSILELLAIEDIGFAERGKGIEFIEESSARINTRGGIIGCGHPVGATGVAQVAEIAAQLSGKAQHRQIKSCTNGLVHNLSAAGSSATVMILGCN